MKILDLAWLVLKVNIHILNKKMELSQMFSLFSLELNTKAQETTFLFEAAK